MKNKFKLILEIEGTKAEFKALYEDIEQHLKGKDIKLLVSDDIELIKI